jgi:hypothetical protein
MVCNPSENSISIPVGPPPSIPGLGGPPFSMPKIPFNDVIFPEAIPEDILEFFESLLALLPFGIEFKGIPDRFTKTIWDFISNLITQIAPFLGFYKFIQALLEIILCIIDVLCALINPFAVIRAIVRLFKQCIPNFLAMFPWLALIIMILALILLLISLIIYLITTIVEYIDQLIENFKVFEKAVQRQGEDEILAAINKIGYLLCLFEEIFAILLAFGALFAIVEPLLGIGGRATCFQGESDCCTDEFCPPFIVNSPITNSSGEMVYYNRISPDFTAFPGLDDLFPNFSLRQESWQLYDVDPGEFKFLDIVIPVFSDRGLFTFWPEGKTYDKDTNPNKAPYLVDMTVLVNPALFKNTSTDTEGEREFNFRDLIITNKPAFDRVNYKNESESIGSSSGVVRIAGGTVWEVTDGYNDGYTQVFVDTGDGPEPATLETFITQIATSSTQLPNVEDGYFFTDISYAFKPNRPVLVGEQLITAMCTPETEAEATVLNTEYNDQRSVQERVGPPPDPVKTVDNLRNLLDNFRKDVNADTAEQFKKDAVAELEALKSASEDYYCNGVCATSDPYTSIVTLTPDLQFVGLPSIIKVELRDKSGGILAQGISNNLGACIAEKITAIPTLGSVSSFVYDGYGAFTSNLESDKSGAGELSVFICGNLIREVLNRNDIDIPSEIRDRIFNYEFVAAERPEEPLVRRTESDIAGDA